MYIGGDFMNTILLTPAKERRVLTKQETKLFLENAKKTKYYNFFIILVYKLCRPLQRDVAMHLFLLCQFSHTISVPV